MFKKISKIPLSLAESAIFEAVGIAACSPVSLPADVCPMIKTCFEKCEIVDLTITSTIRKWDNWKSPESTRSALEDHIRSDSASVGSSEACCLVPYGIPRFYQTRENSLTEPESLPLTAAVLLPAGTEVFSPVDCSMLIVKDVVSLRAANFEVRLRGLVPVGHGFVLKGLLLGHVSADVSCSDPFLPTHISVQLISTAAN